MNASMVTTAFGFDGYRVAKNLGQNRLPLFNHGFGDKINLDLCT
jgi:hypothetical protein